ncbi:MAG TPA: hypothetical protein DHV64_11650 [Erythrobacter sp.]|uniref:Uncharacterized protein n=1 Tax=Actibacterium naphthalenivorans TaxID=1614693 RepID=A0A840C6G6_9RHOB|nr:MULTISPECIES: hypothetical protein [Actibacterium]KGB81864.1 hypothetical protein JT55_11035 [Rhodovulum sp. NI22]MBC55829.1 hypothetical protein [Actibacterium sp.]MDY6858242.1 hypothetical protein [Pseudomonadota bacterium]HCJ22154.1 hypothetical protein [Erythrobacter sp.]ALG89851.1 hypothetical protein TQ29_06130 [Actibacterium sp. EMB200-NS6]
MKQNKDIERLNMNSESMCDCIFQEIVDATEGWPRAAQYTFAVRLASRLVEHTAYEGAGWWSKHVLNDLIMVAAQLDRVASDGGTLTSH